MRNLLGLFGRSPFEPLVAHSRKVHGCVKLIQPIADAVVAGDADQLRKLQHEMSRIEYEADQLKDRVRQSLPSRYFLPVNRDEVAAFLGQTDRIADYAEDFAVIGTLRAIDFPPALRESFLALVGKVVQVSESLLDVAERLAELQKESFVGADTDDVLLRIQQVCHMEWESDKLSRAFAREFFGMADIDPITVMILEKLSRALSGIADSAENVGKKLRLMIVRK